jgi:hypothetical protein
MSALPESGRLQCNGARLLRAKNGHGDMGRVRPYCERARRRAERLCSVALAT